MGGKYSKVVNPHFPLKALEGFDLSVLKDKMTNMSKVMHKAGIYFLTKNDIKWAFDTLTEVQLFQIVSLFDVSQNGNIPSLDFWGALALLSADSNDDKINFCFKMMDLNNDEHLSYSDLVVVMNCATRGVAKLRGYTVIPYEYLDRMAMEAFRVCKKSLSDTGEISMLDYRAVLLSDDLVGQYMSNLGVPVPEVDAAALVTKRSNLLREAITLRAKIAETLCALEECDEDQEQKAHERGGDAGLLRVSEEELAHSREQIALAVAAERRRKLREKGLPVDGAAGEVVVALPLPGQAAGNKGRSPPSATSSAMRVAGALGGTKAKLDEHLAVVHSTVAADPMHPSRLYLKCDNSVFADADMSADKQSSQGIYGDGFRSALKEVWMKLPQDQDLMAELDAYTVIALFDNVMVTLSYEAAQHCLAHVPRSAIGRCCFDDVLRWYLLHGSALATKEVKVTGSALSGLSGGPQGAASNSGSDDKNGAGAWQAFTDACQRRYTYCSDQLASILSKAAYLRAVLDRVDQLVPNRTLKYPNYRHPERSAAAATPSSGTRPGGGGHAAGAKEMGYMMKLVEFRKMTSKKPSNIQLKYVFNHPNVMVLPRPTSSGDGMGGALVPGSRGSPSRERGRPASRGAAVGRGGSRSRSRGKSPGSRPGSREGEQEVTGSPATKTNTAVNAGSGGAGGRPTSSDHNKYTSEAERLPPTKTIKVEEIEDWKLTFKLAFTASPFTNLATKRPKDSSRLRSAAGRFYIEDFPNLQAQDLLDYYNLLQERQLQELLQKEEAEAEQALLQAQQAQQGQDGENSTAASASTFTRGLHKKKAKREAKVYNSVSWCCLELKSHLQPEQVALFAAAVRNFLMAVPFHLRESLYSEVFIQEFAVFKTAEAGNIARQADKVASKFLSSLTGKGDDRAEADALFLAAPKVLLVALYHETDHFAEVEKRLLSSDVFLTRALSSATLDLQLMQTFSDLMEHAAEYVLYGERLFGPQEEDMGEDSMNPIRFAKEVRAKRRRYEELAAGAAKMNRAELAQHCKEMGLKDTGTVAELSRRAREGFELAAELTGYGELSRFGEEVVTKIFHRFKIHPIAKSDEDGGLTLWEFNKLLYHINAPTLYDTAEYQRLMKELQLLVDRDQRLRLHGLQAYYRNSGRLKAENDLLGVGSLDEKLSGRFFFSSTFEPEALASIFNLMGSNALFIPELVQRLTAWAAVRDVRMEGEVDRLSEFFALFDTAAGHKFNKHVLRSPGWLSRMHNELCAALSDGEEGILPALRSYVAREFAGRYSQWEDVLGEGGGFLQAVQLQREADERIIELRRLWAVQDLKLARKAQREQEAAELLQKQQQLRDGTGSMHSSQQSSTAMQQQQSEVSSLASHSPRGSALGSITSAAGQAADAMRFEGDLDEGEEGQAEDEEVEEEFEVVNYATQIDELQQEVLERVIRDTLPPARENNVDLPATVLQLKEDLVFLYRMRGSADLELTLEESTAIFERKQLLSEKIAQAQQLAESGRSLLAAHSCALYDAVRHFTVGLASIGLGSRDCCARGYADGLTLSQYLPRGLGELAPVKQKYVEKVERARQRKASALAALERERRRRNMTEEEKEELRREQRAAQLLAWAKEEAAMFAAAYAALCEAREERKSTAQIGEMVALWEALVVAKEGRHPGQVVTAVCQNALGCILLEFYGSRHPKGAPGQYLLESAVTSMTAILEGLEQEIEAIEEANNPYALPTPKKAAAPATAGAGAAAGAAPAEEKPDPYAEMQRIGLSCMLTMLNYVAVLIETESVGKLQQALQLKRRIYEMYHKLSAQQQERLAQGVVPQISDIPVLAYGKVRPVLERVVSEMEQYLELAAKRAALEAEEALRKRLEEEASLQESSVTEEGSLSKDPKQLRKERREKYAEQRRLDAAKRIEVTKQRKALYEMIQTDRITTIFNARAKGSASADQPGWGEDNEHEMAQLSSEMDALTATLVSSAIEGDTKHEAALARKRASVAAPSAPVEEKAN